MHDTVALCSKKIFNLDEGVKEEFVQGKKDVLIYILYEDSLISKAHLSSRFMIYSIYRYCILWPL